MQRATNRTARWAAVGAGFGALGIIVGSFGSAGAASGDIVITLDKSASGAPGDVITLGTQSVAGRYVGLTCQGTYSASNNASAHPDTQLIISSGGSSVTINGVEDAPGATSTATQPLTLGDTITIAGRLGPDGVASMAGQAVTMDCPAAATTTSSPPSTSTTVVGAAGPVPDAPQTSAASAGPLPATGSDDMIPVLLAVAGGAVAAGIVARRLSLRRAVRDGAR
ncbi:MAG: hypothetical protein RLZZ362_230 [Actinomycetota bacterium]|jgi:hypothetical protein